MHFRTWSDRCEPFRGRRAPGVALFAVLALMAAACGGSDADGLASATETTEVTTAEVETTEPTTELASDDEDADASASDDEDDSGADDGATGEGADGSGEESGDDADDGSCIEGDWTVSEEELAGYYEALGASVGIPMTTTGTARIRFIDLQFAYDATFELQMDVEGMSATGTADGVATGTYVIADGIVSTELAANSLDIVVNVGGIEIDGSDLGSDLLAASPINDAPYSCDGPTIYFQTNGEPHPIKLIPYEG